MALRICFICNEYPPSPHGGIGTFVYNLCHQLTDRGHKCFVIGIDPDVVSSSVKSEDGIYVMRLRSPYANWKGVSIGKYRINARFIFDRLFLSKQLDKWIKTEKIQLVESYDWSGPLWRKTSVPLVVRMHGANTAHCLAEGKPPSRLLSWIEKRNVLLADHLVAVSDFIGEITLRALKLKSENWETIYNGVDISIFRALEIPRDQKQILYVGSLHPRKGIHELIKTFGIVANEDEKAYLKIVGKIPDYPKGTKLLTQLLELLPKMFSDRVEFSGYIPQKDLPEIYNQAGLAVFPSHSEAFGLTCAEAMACGTPVIMTNTGSGPELMVDGVSGLLTNPFSPKIIAEKALSLLNNNELRSKIAQNSIKRIKNQFDSQKTVERNEMIYQKLIRKNGKIKK